MDYTLHACLQRGALTKVAADNAVPCRVILLVKLLLDERSDVLLNVVFLQCLEVEGPSGRRRILNGIYKAAIILNGVGCQD